MDGMHRIARAILDGRSTIKAVRFIAEPEPDYQDCCPKICPTYVVPSGRRGQRATARL